MIIDFDDDKLCTKTPPAENKYNKYVYVHMFNPCMRHKL